MELLLHHVIFNVLVYIVWKFEINLMNEKYPKNTLETLYSMSLNIKRIYKWTWIFFDNDIF
jgi:hypothetical protein